MPSDLSIPTVPPINAGTENAGNGRMSAAASAPAESAAPATLSAPNPTLELDAALGLVVIQFRNDNGAVISSIPTQQQIAAYQLWQETKIGPPPDLGGGTPTPVATPAQG